MRLINVYNLLLTTPLSYIMFIKTNVKTWIESIIVNYTGPELYILKFNLVPLLKFLSVNAIMRIKAFVDLAVTDYPFKETRFRLTYNFLSPFSSRFGVNLYVGLQNALMSLRPLFRSADWLEREAWDMYGIFFLNHNDLRRVLTDYGFRGFPFRKDFPLTGYIELRYDDTKGDVTYEPLELAQELRFFNFSSG